MITILVVQTWINNPGFVLFTNKPLLLSCLYWKSKSKFSFFSLKEHQVFDAVFAGNIHIL